MIVIRLLGIRLRWDMIPSHPLTLPRGFYFNGIFDQFFFHIDLKLELS